MMKKDISVILPIFNINPDYLVQCLDSLCAQTLENIEIILVNDGSTNECLAICDNYRDKDQRVIVISQKNQGVSVARNAGIAVATGDWIAFIDPDDWVEKTYLEQLLVNSQLDVDIVICDCIVNMPDKAVHNHFLPSNLKGEIKDKRILEAQLLSKTLGGYYPDIIAVGVPWAKLFRRKFITDNRLQFVPGMVRMQDNIFCLYAFFYAKKIIYVSEKLYHYRKENTSASFKYNQDIMLHFEKYFEETNQFISLYKNNHEDYINALNIKILTSFNSFLLNNFFHKESPLSYKESKVAIKQLLKSDRYKLALDRANYRMMSLQEKFFVFCLKHNLIDILFIALKLKNI